MKNSKIQRLQRPAFTEKKVTILGIDASLTGTGLAIIQNNRLITATLKNKLKGVERLLFIIDEITQVILTYKPDIIMLENYAFARANQAHQIGELGGLIRCLCSSVDGDFYTVAPQALKKYLTGKGNTKKELMGKEIFKRHQIDLDSGDEVDAAVLALVGLRLAGDMHGATQYQEEVMGKIIKAKKLKYSPIFTKFAIDCVEKN